MKAVQSGQKAIAKLKSYSANKKPLIPFFILVFLIVLFSIFTPKGSFLSKETVHVFLTYVPEIALITIGMGILLLLGDIDLSVGSIYVFSSVIMAGAIKYLGIGCIPAALLTLAAGVSMGALNGFLISRTKITSFIVTLATMWAYRGIMLVLVGGGAIAFAPTPLERSVLFVFAGNVFGMPMQFIWLLVLCFVLRLVLHHMPFGNHVFSTGSNKRAAKMMGINVDRIKIACYAISGFLCAFAGFIQVSRTSNAIPQSGDLVNLMAIAGAIVGGTSLDGGRGSVLGSLFGAFIMQVLSLGFIMMGFTEYYTNIVIAIALLATAIIYNKLDSSKVEG